jgi:5-methylcytosine-specific restriction protein A
MPSPSPREPRRNAYQRGYTKRWARAAKAFRLQYPLCGMRPHDEPPVMSACHDAQRCTAATQTDHVVPHRGDPVLFWDATHNWQSLCATCGARKTQAGL